MKRIAITILASSLFFTACKNQTREIDLTRVRQLYLQSLERESVAEKRDLRRQIVELAPESSYGLFSRGYLTDNREEARTLYTAALEKNETLSAAWYNRGNVNLETGRYHQALSDYNRAIKYRMDHAEVYNNRGLARRNLGDLRGALHDFTMAVDMDSDFRAARMNRDELKRVLDRTDTNGRKRTKRTGDPMERLKQLRP
jgi:tetratricopeptide (TPR) repeat protein